MVIAAGSVPDGAERMRFVQDFLIPYGMAVDVALFKADMAHRPVRLTDISLLDVLVFWDTFVGSDA